MAVDTELTLDMLRVQLLRLEHEMSALRRIVGQMQESQSHPPRPFESLEGIWEGVVFSEEDFQVARIKIPEDI